jgi:hypothetical protein
VSDYPDGIDCAFCATPLRKRQMAVRIRTDCEVFDLCDQCYQGHRLLELRDETDGPRAALGLRAVLAQKAALLLIGSLATAALDPDDAANVRLMQRVAEMITAGEGS